MENCYIDITKQGREPLLRNRFKVSFPQRWNIPEYCITDFDYSFDTKMIHARVNEIEGEQIMENTCRLYDLGLARNGDEIICEILSADGSVASRRVYRVNKLINMQEVSLSYSNTAILSIHLTFDASIISVEDFTKTTA